MIIPQQIKIQNEKKLLYLDNNKNYEGNDLR